MLVPGSLQIDGYPHHLAFFYRPVFWVAYSRPGVGVLPPLDLSVIADLIPPDHRNVYLSRLEGCLSVAYVIGPVIGAFLSQISLHFPFYAASAIATLATISALLFLKESNPLVVDEEGNRRPKKLQSVFSRFSPTVTKTKEKAPRPHLTLLTIMCFAEEFCVRWSLNAYDSRYGIYLKDKFNIKSSQYS